jgi:hypothetical protein
MKNVILMLALAFTCLTVSAQGTNRSPGSTKLDMEEKAEERLEYMTIVLDLTPEQVAKIKKMQLAHGEKLNAIKSQYQPILDKMKAEMKAVKASTEGNPEAGKAKMKIIHEKYKPDLAPMKAAMEAEKAVFDKNLIGVLDANQAEKYKKLEAIKAAKKEEMKGRWEEGKHPHGEHDMEGGHPFGE